MALLTSGRIFFRAARQFGANGGAQMGAALAYYALFSTAPLFILAVMLAGPVFGEQAARERVREHVSQLVGPETAREVDALDGVSREARRWNDCRPFRRRRALNWCARCVLAHPPVPARDLASGTNGKERSDRDAA